MSGVNLKTHQVLNIQHVVRNSTGSLCFIIKSLCKASPSEKIKKEYMNLAIQKLKDIEEVIPHHDFR